MRISITALALLVAGTRVFARDFPQCVQTCINNNLSSSFCDGDETGQELDACTCAGLAQAPMIPCIRKCPEADQSEYAAVVPESCRESILPGIVPAASNTEDEGGSQSSTSGGSGNGTPPPTATPDAAMGRPAPGMVAAGGLLAALLL